MLNPHLNKARKRISDSKKNKVYQAPSVYAGIFYLLLAVWTVVCVLLIGSKATKSGWPMGQLLMIAFVLAYTWYFSLGISYKIQVEDSGDVLLTSFRRVLKVNAGKIEIVEGPHFSIGFIRFRLEREKAYLFSLINDRSLQRILSSIRSLNPEVKFKGLVVSFADHIDS